MMNSMMNGGMGPPMIGSMLFGITLWILLLAVLIWALLPWLNRPWGKPKVQRTFPSPKEPTAQEIMEQRYTGCEIDHATGEQMRKPFQVVLRPVNRQTR